MINTEHVTTIVITLFSIQVATFFLLILLKQIFPKLSEKSIIGIVTSNTLCSILLISILAIAILTKENYLINLGIWFGTEDSKYDIVFVVDLLAVIYALFASIMIGLVAIFSRRYLHRESGYFRFYTFMVLFLLGVNIISFAGSMEITIIGWEFVGLSSVSLISFFNYRTAPVQNAFWVFTNYRICDIGLFAAALTMHSFMHSADFGTLNEAAWFGISANHAPTILGFLILFGAMGKSALFPFSGWLPRAMEGPTPSSAIFYGSVSIHFGPLLLLRSADLIATSPLLASTVITIGVFTALVARLIAHAQTDIKSMIAFESVMQVGLIVAEIGFGFNTIALIHIVGHSGYRTLQMLRAPSLIRDLRTISQMLGRNIASFSSNRKKSDWHYWVYRIILEKCCMDNIVKDYFVRYLLMPFRYIDRIETNWSNWLTKTRSQTSSYKTKS